MFVILGRGRRATGPKLAFLLLAFVGMYLWSLRPLSETEQKLVGTWALNSDSRIQLRLAPNRQAFIQAPATGGRLPHPDAEPLEDLEFIRIGTWSASEMWLTIWKGRFRRSVWRLIGTPTTSESETRASRGGWGGHNPSRTFRYLDTDYVKLGSELYFRVRSDP